MIRSAHTDPSKIVEDGRYTVVDSFEETVERTNDLEYAKGRAVSNDGWVVDEKTGRTVFDSDDE